SASPAETSTTAAPTRSRVALRRVAVVSVAAAGSVMRKISLAMVPQYSLCSPCRQTMTKKGRCGLQRPLRIWKVQPRVAPLLLCGAVEFSRPLPTRSQRIHAGAMGEGRAGGFDVFRLAGPGGESIGLERAAIREGQGPGKLAHMLHCRKVGAGLFAGLAARKEGNAGNDGWHGRLEG